MFPSVISLANISSEEMWLEFKTVIDTLSLSSDVRAIIISGAGDRAFTAGLDVQAASQNGILAQTSTTPNDAARKAVLIKRHVQEFQDCVSSVEKCEKRKPPLTLYGSAMGKHWADREEI
jgi:Delta3,5-Delta2,4-dienoyl-CoA isomerase